MKLRISPNATAKKREIVIGRSTQNFLRNLLPGGGGTTHGRHDRPLLDPNLGPSLPVLANCAHEVWQDPSTGASIYLGPRYAAAASLSELQGHGITAVVNCTKRVPNHHAPTLHYCVVAVNDTEAADILTYLHGATLFLHSYLAKGESVLVHCEAGVSRSTTVVLAYLVQYQHMTRDEAYVHVKERRRLVNPNDGFWHQLSLFAKHKQTTTTTTTTELATPDSLRNNRHRHRAKVDYEWAKASAATYATCREMACESDKAIMMEHCFQACREKQFACHPQQTLLCALDFIWGRAVMKHEVEWLAQVCRVLDEAGPTSLPGTCAQLVKELLTDPTSTFCDEWQGEVYPEWVERVLTALVVSDERRNSIND